MGKGISIATERDPRDLQADRERGVCDSRNPAPTLSEVWIQLGKLGDIISILPILLREYERTGVKPKLMVAEDYATVLEQIDYVDVLVYDGHFQDLKGAVTDAKKKFDRVNVTQVNGSDIVFEHRHPSFQHDMWDRVGMLDHWDSLPLVIKRPPVVCNLKGFIFFADYSQSSPFFYKDELADLLKKAFPGKKIFRTSEARFNEFFEYLPYMDAADLIVTVDTAFLHLAKATATPIIALVSSRPTPWRGSAWSKRFAFHCRYDDFQFRKGELLDAAVCAVKGVDMICPKVVPTQNRFGYNMTVSTVEGFHVQPYRYHPDSSWKTRLAIGGKDIAFPKSCAGMSLEDPRFFTLHGKPHLAYVAAIEIGGEFRAVQAYGPLVYKGDSIWAIEKHIIPSWGAQGFEAMEKNWVPFEYDGMLHFIYGIQDARQIVIRNAEGKWQAMASPAPTWKWGVVRGGCITTYRDNWIRFFHSRIGNRYYLGAALMDREPPFRTTMVSHSPIYAGDERYMPGCKHWKANCILPYGVEKSDGRFKVYCGRNDCECVVFNLAYKELNL